MVQNTLTTSRNQTRLNAVRSELSSGGVTPNYIGINSPGLFVSQEAFLERIDAYITDNAYFQNKLNYINTQIDSLRTTALELQNKISLTVSGSLIMNENLQQTVQGMLLQTQNILNSTYGGEYLFSGTAATVPAVTDLISNFPTPSTGSGPNTTYYLGDSGTQSISLNDVSSISTTIRANDPSIEQLIRALKLCETASINPLDLQRFNQASTLCSQALVGLTDIDAQLRQSQAQILTVNDTLSEQKQLLQEQIQKIGYRDMSAILQESVQIKSEIDIATSVSSMMYASLQRLLDSVPT
jgi:flagellar hook-associated protein 3 FlgL